MVGTHCCVPRCSSNKTKCRGLSFHYFPKNVEISKQWLVNIHRDIGLRVKIQPWTVVCSRHFTDDCFDSRCGNSEFTRVLKRGAIPTKFEWNNWGEEQRSVENLSASKMPREIKTPLRYQNESEKRQPIRTGKRGRPRLACNEAKYKDTKKDTSSSEPVIIPDDDDDDSDVEIIDVTKPPTKKKKTDYDPDWGHEKKIGSGKPKIKSKEKPVKTSPTAPVQTSELVKNVEAQKTPVTTIVSKKAQTPTPSSFIELFMECKDEPLSPAQIQSAQKEQSFYDMSQTLVKAAREGRLIFSPEGGVIILDKPCSMLLVPQTPQTPVLTSPVPVAAHTPPLIINTGELLSSLAANDTMLIDEERSPLLLRRKKTAEISFTKDKTPLFRKRTRFSFVLQSSDAITSPSEVVKTSVLTSVLDKRLTRADHKCKKYNTTLANIDKKKCTSKKKKSQIKRGLSKSKLRNLNTRHLISLRTARLLREKIQHSEKYAAYLAEEKIKRERIQEINKKRKELLKIQSLANSYKRSNTPSSSRTKSPDLVILGETPPRLIPSVGSNTPPSHAVGKQNHVFNNHGVKSTWTPPDLSKSNQVIPRSITSVQAKAQSEALTKLRQQMQQDAQAKSESEPSKKKVKKIAQLLDDETGNWVPLDEYYYGKTEGDPTYHEQKGELRFKCWYCNKMLYNNVAAMMHIQGHIDAERQVNLDLSDLTQCKHCYKQFDTPFEMQTHIEKVHMNNANVLLCRICEKDHDSRYALTDHMKRNHNACEMPYICQLCKFRSSMYSDVVDHFKKKHNSSESMLCLYCLRVYQIRFVSQGWGQTSIYYNHLMKHQIKNCCKKCNHCKLVFLNSTDLKAHRKTDHLPNQKGVIGINAKYTTPHQVMIKVTEKVDQLGGIKSLNVPAVKKILEHKLSFPHNVYKVKCIECKMLMGIPDHYKKFIQCSMCRFATSCSFAYAHHMMGFHSGQLTAAASHTPQEAKLQDILYCACGFQSSYGNRIANHLVACSKISCSKDQPPPSLAGEYGQELQDPRKKPDASLLDVLGLVKKDSLPASSSRLRYDSPPPEPVEMPEVSSVDILPRRPSLLKDSKKKGKNNLKEETESKYDHLSADEKNWELVDTKPALSDDREGNLDDSKVETKDKCESKTDVKESVNQSSFLKAQSDKRKIDSEREEFEQSPDERTPTLKDDTEPELSQIKQCSQTEKDGSNENENMNTEGAPCLVEKETLENNADGKRVCVGNETDSSSDGNSTEQQTDVPLVNKQGASSSIHGLMNDEDKVIKQVASNTACKNTTDVSLNNHAVKESDDTSLQQSYTYEDGTVFTRGLKSDSRAGLVLASDFNDDDSRVNDEVGNLINNEDSQSSDYKGFFSDVAAQEKDSNSEADAQSKVMFDLEESTDSRLVEMSDTYPRLSSTVNKLGGIFSLEEGSSDARDWSDRAHRTTSLMPDDSCNVSQTVEDESSAAEKESTSSSELSTQDATKSEKQVIEKAATCTEDETNVDESVVLSTAAPNTSDLLSESLEGHTDILGSNVKSGDQDIESLTAEILTGQPEPAGNSDSLIAFQAKPDSSLESPSVDPCCSPPEPDDSTAHLSQEAEPSPSTINVEAPIEPDDSQMPKSSQSLPYCSNDHEISHAEADTIIRSEETETALASLPATSTSLAAPICSNSPALPDVELNYSGAQEAPCLELDNLHSEVDPVSLDIPAVSQAYSDNPDVPKVDQVEPDDLNTHIVSHEEPDISEKLEVNQLDQGNSSIPQLSEIECNSSVSQIALPETHSNTSCLDKTLNENDISERSLKSDTEVPSTSESLSTIGSEAPSVQGSQSATSADYDRNDRTRSRSKSRSQDYRRERRSRSRSRDNYRDTDRERSRYYERDRYDRDRGRYRDSERDSYDRDRYSHHSRDRDFGRSRDFGRNRDSRESGHSRDYGRSRDNRDYGHSRDRNDRDTNRYRDRR